MEATPDEYRADIAHTRRHIALIDGGELLGETPEQARERRAVLVRQLADLERSLARVEPLWAHAQQQGAGRRMTQEQETEKMKDRYIYACSMGRWYVIDLGNKENSYSYDGEDINGQIVEECRTRNEAIAACRRRNEEDR